MSQQRFCEIRIWIKDQIVSDWSITPIFQYFAFIPFSNEERKKAANFEVIKYLIEKGAEVDGKNARGKTPLYYAVKNNLDMEIVEYFITKGADSYAKNGQTLVADDFCPLEMAIGKKEAQNAS